MNRETAYGHWAPDGSVWSRWAKPVLFTHIQDSATPSAPLAAIELPAALPPPPGTALILDLPGPESILTGLALARRGFRPVPLFNSTHGANALVDVDAILCWLVPGAELLAASGLPADAPPAFLLDSQRKAPGRSPAPGKWDNRWLTFPQDFPSSAFLQSRGIAEVLLVLRGAGEPDPDLAHVLLPWQQSGLRLRVCDLATGGAPGDLRVRTPSRFRQAWYRALAILGLRRSNVGGFGAQVPTPTQGGRTGFYG